MSLKALAGLVSIIVAIACYLPYISDILKKKTKPHAFSWLVWSVLSGIAFTVQLTNNGGAGSWLMGLTMLATFSVFILSLRFGEPNILLVDWLCLLFAGIALALWAATDNPLTAIVLISLVDIVGGFLPTFRKSISKPHEETVITYFLFAISLCFSLLALEDFSLVNALYPATFVVINLAMVFFLNIRRKQLR